MNKSFKRKKTNYQCYDNESKAEPTSYLVSRIKNTIYFYENVTKESVYELIKLIKEANDYVKRRSSEIGGGGVIYIHICSDGGCVYSGLAAMDTISSNEVPIITVMEGAVCSAATFIALGGKHVRIRPSCEVLIHQISSEFWGKYEEFNDEKETLDKLMKKLRHLYEKKTEIPKKVLDKLFKRDIYIDSTDCIKWKVADGAF
jgi:ATP-dependent protease ClpP protease subunit